MRVYESRNKRKRETQKRFTRSPFERRHASCWRRTSQKLGVPVVIFSLWWLCYELPGGLAQNDRNPSWQTTAAWEHDRDALSSLRGKRGLADHITVPRAIFVFTRHTSGRPKWLAIHASEGLETRIEPSRRLNVHARTVTQGVRKYLSVHTISVFRSWTFQNIRRLMDKAGEECDV